MIFIINQLIINFIQVFEKYFTLILIFFQEKIKP